MRAIRRCDQCEFWDNSAQSAHSDADTGECRRRPPGFDDRTKLAVWPFVEDRDWCGDFVEDAERAAEREAEEFGS